MADTSDTSTPVTPLSRALDTIKKLQEQLRAQSGATPLAVVGIGLRFPGGVSDLDGYWKVLVEGQDLVHSLPAARMGPFAAEWARLPHNGGFFADVMAFDADFFELTAEQARGLDPQHRLLLEVAWEAMEDAALPPDRIQGARAGLYIGITGQEYWHWLTGEPDANWAGGNGHCFAVGRLAYALGLAGPAITVDTACSSSLVSVHLARQALSRRECDLALAGGVNLVLSPHQSRLYQLGGMLSTEGRCRAFDAGAGGLVRGEGCGIVVLKRLDDALRDGDRIHAVLHGSAVNQAARSTGFGAPNVLSQVTLLETALADAGLSPADIGLVEAHGTGTSLGDSIELDAIATVLSRKEGSPPLPIGSVKTNMGHLEAAAGIASLIKAILCVRHQTVPPLLHFSALNPLIELDGTGITLPTTAQPWPAGSGRYAGVSAFGMGGTNAHVIVGPAEQTPAPPAAPVWGFELSAKTPAALRELAARLHERLAQLADSSYPAFAYSVTFGRARHRWCARITAGDRQAALAALRGLAEDRPDQATKRYEYDHWGDEDHGELPPLPRAVVDLPRYPWQRQRYAPEGVDVHTGPAETGDDGTAGGADQADTDAEQAAELRRQLLAVPPGRRRRNLLIQHCRQVTAEVLGTEVAGIDPGAPLSSLGITSAGALELRTRLERSLQVKLPATVGWRYPTLAALAPFLAERMGIDLDAPTPPTAPDPRPERAEESGASGASDASGLSDVDALASEQVRARLLAKIDELDHELDEGQ